MTQKACLFLCALLFFGSVQAQLFEDQEAYTRADSLRGGLRPERTGFDVTKYDLSVAVDPEERFISGNNKISFEVVHELPVMQLDLFENMAIDSILFQGEKLNYKREHHAVFINFQDTLKRGLKDTINVYYSGNPEVAENPPWDGGFIFTKDENGKDWISVAVQGTGASLWYPNKDTQSDEPEEAEIHVTTPKGLKNISNGRFTGKEDLADGRTTWSWKVINPINNYNLILNIGDYEHFSDHYKDVDLDYYVLPYNVEKAKKHFEEVKPMMKCFSEKFGAYPFKEDGYKLIETPYLGMEHQSAVGYGNHYKKGYAGQDRSGTGVGMKWDFIIIHESGHEWFGNSITAADIADMWIHEAFTTYAEAVYTECRWGKEDALNYLKGLRSTTIENRSPIIGDYGVNKSGSGDMYAKGANMLLTIRSLIDNDKKWWKLLKDFHETYKLQIINSQDVIHFFDAHTQVDLVPVFEQYLRSPNLPELQLKKEDGKVHYRWKADAMHFNMPIDVTLSEEQTRLTPTTDWQVLEETTALDDIEVDTANFYIEVKKL